MKERARLAFLLLGFGAAPIPAQAAQDIPALIKRQSQRFSDASASGDAAVLARLLDKDVVFINENGEIGSKKDVVESAGRPPAGISNKLVQSDFVSRCTARSRLRRSRTTRPSTFTVKRCMRVIFRLRSGSTSAALGA